MARGDSRRLFCIQKFRLVVVAFVVIAMMSTRRATALVGGWRFTTRRLNHNLSRSNAIQSSTSQFPIQSQCIDNTRHQSPRFRSDCILMATVDEDEVIDSQKTLQSTWNIGGLKKEVTRLVLRCHKKIAKSSTRLTNAQALIEKLTADDSATLEQLEQCPDIDALEFELQQLKSRLVKLNELEGLLQGEKKKQGVLPEQVATLALDLGVNDEPPARPPRGPKKPKGPRQEAKRLPYRRFYTVDKTEIRVRTRCVMCIISVFCLNARLTISPHFYHCRLESKQKIMMSFH